MKDLKEYIYVGGPYDGKRLTKLNSDRRETIKDRLESELRAGMGALPALPTPTHSYRLRSHPEFGEAMVWLPK